MEMATPQRRDVQKRRSLFNVSVSSPLRRSAGPSNVVLGPVDDESERSTRRDAVVMLRRLTNISATSSPGPDTISFMEENQIHDHLRICTKLYSENRISAKNAWQLHVIDVIKKIARNDTKINVLQVAGSSLDIGTKVYGLRVDDVHSKCLQLVNTISKNDERQAQLNDGNETNDRTINPEERRANTRKKAKKLTADKKNIIDREGKTIFAPIKKIESVVFATKENIEVSATDNLFTNKLHIDPSSHKFMLLSEEKAWTTKPDVSLTDEADRIFDIELPEVSDFNLCTAFKDFEIGSWDPEKEDQILRENHTIPEPVLDENGIPIADLDGSIHDIFQDDEMLQDPVTDNEEVDVFQVQLHGEIAEIEDAVPEASRIETDYGFNTLVRASSGKYIDKIWAGPSHWKVKFNKRSLGRYSGTTVQTVFNKQRKVKVPSKINFSSTPDDWDDIPKFVTKRVSSKVCVEKVTLPIPDLCFEDFAKEIEYSTLRPSERRSKLKNAVRENEEYEIPAYNYENPNDSHYCSQQNSDDLHDDPVPDSFEQEFPQQQQQFLGDNLVNAPEMVSDVHIRYAMQAKKMDMKKLKNAMWKNLTDGHEDVNALIPKKFSNLYQQLPQVLTPEMKKDLSCPLAVLALLHLCNDHSLLLQKNSDSFDFMITKARK